MTFRGVTSQLLYTDEYAVQIIDGKNKLDDFRNGFINLALPFFGFSDPIAAAKKKVNAFYCAVLHFYFRDSMNG